MDLSVIKAAVEAVVTDSDDGELADVVLLAASALPAEASDFDRGMAAGYAAAMLLKMRPTIE